MYGRSESMGTPNSLRPSLKRLMPPRSTVPPSGTLTVVVTDTKEKVGNCTVVPECVVELELFCFVASVGLTWLPVREVSMVVESEPVKVNVFTSPILLKNGTTVNRTKRRSCETTAWTVMKVPSESTTMTGCWAAAKSPTTGNHARHERRLRLIGDERLLAVEQRDLGGLQHVRPFVALGGIDEEVGFDVAEDGESHRGAGRRIETAELRNRQAEAVLPEGDVEVRGETGWPDRRCRHAAGHADGGVLVADGEHGIAGGFRLDARLLCRGVVGRAEAGGGLAPVVIVDVEVEIDADAFEEVVVEGDEADFDRDLQILHPPQLAEKIDDFLVNFLGLADDDAQVGFEGLDRTRAAHVVPGGGLDGLGDQIDEAVEVGLRAAAQAAGAESDRTGRAAGRTARRRRSSRCWVGKLGHEFGIHHAALRLCRCCRPRRPGASWSG